jgi:hypothetical protein
MASACASATAADRRRTRPPMLTTTPVATSRTTVMTWASESMTPCTERLSVASGRPVARAGGRTRGALLSSNDFGSK